MNFTGILVGQEAYREDRMRFWDVEGTDAIFKKNIPSELFVTLRFWDEIKAYSQNYLDGTRSFAYDEIKKNEYKISAEL